MLNKKDQAEFPDKVQHIAAQRHPSLIDEVADDNTAEIAEHRQYFKADTAHLMLLIHKPTPPPTPERC